MFHYGIIMTDIRKRTGKKGVTYQVRYPIKATKSGYAYKSFNTLKEARALAGGRASEAPAAWPAWHCHSRRRDHRWLDVCRHEGRRGKDPVSKATMAGYSDRNT
jgi:integrase